MVILGHGSFSLEHLDKHRRLVVLVGGKHLDLFGGDHAVSLDDGRHDSPHSFDALASIHNKQSEKVGRSFF